MRERSRGGMAGSRRWLTLRRFDARRQVLSLCGVDEAGRGPLAGPVVAAAVILPPDVRLRGVDDSKRLVRAERERLSVEIARAALAHAVAESDVPTIDRLNI